MNRAKECKLMGIVSIILAIALLFSSCGSSENKTTTDQTSTSSAETGDQLVECKYTERDLDGTYDESEATKVTLEDSYTIKEEGVYIFTGTLSDGQIIVEADDSAKVQIVLDNVNITCSDGPAIYGVSADKIFVTLAEGTENTLSDGSTYSSAEDQPWGCLFSTTDLTINGSGKLTVNGNYNNGIVSKDDLRITGGTIDVEAVNNGLKGRDSVGIYDGTINITAYNDGIKSNNDEEEGKGYVSIDGGAVNIQGVTSQGIQGAKVVQLVSGALTIDSENEGIESPIIYISGTKSTISASDDGLNASSSTSSGEGMDAAEEGVYIKIIGGETNLSANGDGLDSNGDLYISGGTTIVNGPTSGGDGALDYAGTGEITGGTIIAIGASQMAQSFGSGSTQGVIMNNSVSGSSGDTVALLDSDGNQLATMTSTINFTSVVISAPDMTSGSTYTLQVGSSSTDITLTDTITTIGGSSMGGGTPGGNMGGSPGGNSPGGF